MYEEHFGLTGRPFQLTPDPRFWFETATHRKAMSYLGYGLAQGEGFIVITGDIGAGKTTLVGHLMERIDPTRLNPIKIVSTAIEADDLLRVVAGGLGIDAPGKSKAELLQLIERGLHGVARTGRRTLLIVDEAQALPVSALEELRMLSNFQAGGHALLQIFLLGQPEFRDRLHGSDRLEQLRQRVIATHHLDPMEPEEVEPYIAHRLSLVGWQGRPDFADEAFPVMFWASQGLPRVLNQLAGRVLLHCAVEGVELIDAGTVMAVAGEMLGGGAATAPEDAPVQDNEPVAIEAPEPETPMLRPMTPASPSATPRPIRLATAEPATARPLALAPTVSGDRLAALEARVEEQDTALRRVLTLLVDWVEGDAKTPARDAA